MLFYLCDIFWCDCTWHFVKRYFLPFFYIYYLICSVKYSNISSPPSYKTISVRHLHAYVDCTWRWLRRVKNGNGIFDLFLDSLTPWFAPESNSKISTPLVTWLHVLGIFLPNLVFIQLTLLNWFCMELGELAKKNGFWDFVDWFHNFSQLWAQFGSDPKNWFQICSF